MIESAKFEPFSFHSFETEFLTRYYSKLSGEDDKSLFLNLVGQSPTTFRPVAVGHRMRYTLVVKSGSQDIIIY